MGSSRGCILLHALTPAFEIGVSNAGTLLARLFCLGSDEAPWPTNIRTGAQGSRPAANYAPSTLIGRRLTGDRLQQGGF